MDHSERSGILLALCGFALLSVGDAVIKTMAGEWSPLAVASVRFAIGAIGLSALLAMTEGPKAFRPSSPRLQFARGVCLAAASLLFFSAIFVMPLATAMSLAFVSPVIVAVLSGPLLGEKVRPAVWLASVIALVGVALVLRPNLYALGPVALLPLASAFFFALMVIANRASAGQGSALSMQVFMQVGAMPVLIVAAFGGHFSGVDALSVTVPDWTVIARCAVVAVTASSAHWLVYMGTQRAGASTIAPTTYVQMLVATSLGWWWFGDVPDLMTLLGATIIIGAGLILWWSTPRASQTMSR
ncbi:DMT family transporter [Qipengyuania sp. GH38]|uniref:DMT family transporter n=1 Tax=Qipengyuania intermedia TaxID=2867244 RepID=UPI001C86918E|nr:DMT family transporter [Qipengyuania intermedia]MBX7513223.1 DMT family transporter [Qipengyuania intermedia]